MAITYSAGNLTDGVVDLEFVEERVPDGRTRKSLTDALVGLNLWHTHPEGWEINNYNEFNPTRKSVESRREDKAAAGRKGAAARWGDGKPIAGAISTDESELMADECPRPDPTRPDPAKEKSNTGDEVRIVFEYWQQQCGHPDARLTADRRRKIEARIKEGYTSDTIRSAIDGASVGAFVADNGKRFDDIELICRNGSKLESFIGRKATTQSQSTRGRVVADQNSYLQYYDNPEKAA